MLKINYQHLYNTNVYTPPSVARQISRATPSPTSQIGEIKLANNNDIGGANSMDRFISNKLEGKDIYRNMSNKTVYGTSSSITAHASLNKF